MNSPNYIACHECDLLHRRPGLPPGATAVCRRCGAVLCRNRSVSPDLPIALALSGILFFILANYFPFLTMTVEGQIQETTLVTGVVELYQAEMPLLALLVLATGIVFPFVELCGLIYILVPLKFNRIPWHMATVFRCLIALKPWAMMEVFLLGILVAMVKLLKMADIIPGIGLFAFLVLIFLIAATAASVNPESVWQRLPIRS
jgi:paraquat-inducible protein A